MFGRRKQTSTRIDTLLGKTATLNGDLEFSGGLHLDGRVNGNVRSTAEDGGALSVSESGFIEGNVEVTNIVMNGTVNGDMHARDRLVLGGSARVNGNVHYGVIEMAPGAVITGKLIPLGKGPGGRRRGNPARDGLRRLRRQNPARSVQPMTETETETLTFTDAAARKVGDLIRGEGNPNLKLRVFVQGGGCSGMQYGFEFDEQEQDGDTCVENLGVKLLIDPMSVQYLTGAEIDYREGLDGAQFVIRNPNAQTTCGCGSSFSA